VQTEKKLKSVINMVGDSKETGS